MDDELDLDGLLAGIAAGDAEAFGAFMSQAEIPVRRSLRSFAAQVDVEVVVQESFLRVWQTAARFRPDGRKNALLRFTLRVARNLALMSLRRHREEQGEPEEVPTVGPEESDPLLREIIRGCFEKLPAKPKQALSARLESGGSDTDHDLAEQTGMRLNTLLQNVSRARKLLIECLQAHGAPWQGGTR